MHSSVQIALVEWLGLFTPEMAALILKANTDYGSITPEEDILMGAVIMRLLLKLATFRLRPSSRDRFSSLKLRCITRQS